MTDMKRKPKPMTSKELAQYQELRARLVVQAELIMSIFSPLNDREYVTEVKFEEGHPLGPQIKIHYDGYAFPYGEDYHEFFSCPESYFGMTADELKAEKTRLEEEEKRKKAERAAKTKAAREKRKAEKAKKEAEKKANEKDERYKKYLELKAEFEGGKGPEDTDKPKKESVYECAHFELDQDDPSGCGETWSWCHNEKSGTRECDCKYIYAQQFCPFYKKGKLRGRWVIHDGELEAAKMFKKKFESKEDK